MSVVDLKREGDVAEARLSNGLRALIVQQTGAPVVSVQTWYRVGSREEDKGRTGLAHFLEHLMFKGTETLRRGDIDLVTLRNGGQNNADTTTDRTRYYFTFAADRYERALEIEADRMRGSAFDEHEFRMERGPVIEELRRDRDDPWWALHETLEATAYQVHPYRNPVIGWPEEIVSVPRADVLAFYERWYQPWNCTLVVVGDVDADEAVERIDALFGDLPGGEAPDHFVPAEPGQEGERRFELLLDVHDPRMIAGFHTVRVSDPEDPVLDVIQILLVGGKSSLLYDRLVRRDELAATVSAGNDTRRDPGLFMFFMELREGVDPAAAEAALWEEVARLATDGPDPDHLERVRAMVRAGRVFRKATAAGRAEVLGTLQVLGGDWRLEERAAQAVETMTAEDVRSVAERFFVRHNRTVGWAFPRPDGVPPRPPIPEDADRDASDDGSDDERPEPAILQRAPAGRLRVSLPGVRTVLPNGLRVIVLPRAGVGELAVRAHVDAGRAREARPGLGALAGACLDEGAAGRDGAAIAEWLAARGAALGAGAGGVALRCLTRDAAEALDVARDVLLHPEFPAEPVERKRGELTSMLRAEDDDPSSVGRFRIAREIYGGHPFARRDKGDAEALAALTRDDVVAHHAALFVPRNAIVSVVGDVTVDEGLRLIEDRFGAWTDRASPPRRVQEPSPSAPREIHIEEDRDQLHAYFGHVGIRRDDPDYDALLLADYVLGSGPGFTDRLSQKLRDEEGLAYTVWARIARSAGIEPGTFMAYIGTAPDTRDRAVAGMRREIERFASGDAPITQREFDDAKSYLLGNYVFGFETCPGTAEALVGFERHGYGCDYPDQFVAAIEALTPAVVQAAVARHIHPDRMILVTVGRSIK